MSNYHTEYSEYFLQYNNTVIVIRDLCPQIRKKN